MKKSPSARIGRWLLVLAGLVVGLLWACRTILADTPAVLPTTDATRGEDLSVVLGPATWRFVQAEVDDVYHEPAVSRLRDDVVFESVRLMTKADLSTSWPAREAGRKNAQDVLRQGAAKMQDLAEKAQGEPAKQEAGLAVVELLQKAGEGRAAIRSGVALLERLPAGPLKAQAFHYVIQGYLQVGDAENAKRYMATSRQGERPQQRADSFYLGGPPSGALRDATEKYQGAQSFDDSAMQMLVVAPERPEARDTLRLRDTALAEVGRVLRRYPPAPRQSRHTLAEVGLTPPAAAATQPFSISAEAARPTGVLVSGTVTLSDGTTPLASAVVLVEDPGIAKRPGHGAVITDKAGAFAKYVPPGAYTLRVLVGTATVALQPLTIAKEAGLVVVQLRAAAGSMTGTVVDGAGQAVGNVHVGLFDVPRRLAYSAKTDEQGHYAIKMVLPGQYNATAITADGSQGCMEKNVVVDAQAIKKDLTVGPLPVKNGAPNP